MIATDHAATATTSYTTETGHEPTGTVAFDLFLELALSHTPDEFEYDLEPFCFVCGRCTDHFAEHDDLVEAGLAEYTADGSVRRIAR